MSSTSLATSFTELVGCSFEPHEVSFLDLEEMCLISSCFHNLWGSGGVETTILSMEWPRLNLKRENRASLDASLVRVLNPSVSLSVSAASLLEPLCLRRVVPYLLHSVV